MIQVGIIMIAIAIQALYSGDAVIGLLCLSGGLTMISGRSSHLKMKVTWKGLITPVGDDDDIGAFELAARLASHVVFVVAIVVAFVDFIDGWYWPAFGRH